MTINGSTNSSNWTFKLEAYELTNTINIENNTSVVRVEMFIGRTNSRSYLGGNYSAYINVDGQNQSFNGNIPYPTYINAGEWYYLATKDFTITHTDDGSKVVNVVSEMTSSDFSPSYCYANGDLTLTTIPRASTITATSAYIEETSQLTINKKSDLFTHSIQFYFNNLTGYILADGTISQSEQKITATSIGFTIPSTFYSQIPNSMEGVCNLWIRTYNGNQQIGNAQNATFYARVNPSTNAPTTTTTMSDTNQDTIALTGSNDIFVVGHSIISLVWSATAQNSATISSVKLNDTTLTQSPYTFTMPQSANYVVTDSRGLITNPNIFNSYTIKNYFNPNAVVTIEREEPTSNYALLTFNGSFWNDNFGSEGNSLAITWKYRQKNTQQWTTGGTLVKDTNYTINGNNFYSGTTSAPTSIKIGGSMAYANAWDVLLVLQDELETTELLVTMPQGIPIVNWDDTHFNVNGDLTINEESINGTILYSSSGTNTSILLNDDVSNYEKIVIIYTDDNARHSSTTIYNPNQKRSTLSVISYDQTQQIVSIRGKNIYIYSNHIDNEDYQVAFILPTGNVLYSDNDIFIVKVIGFK